MTWIFSLDNGLSVKTETGTTKFKLKGGAKAFGCNQVEVKTTFKLSKQSPEGKLNPIRVNGSSMETFNFTIDHRFIDGGKSRSINKAI